MEKANAAHTWRRALLALSTSLLCAAAVSVQGSAKMAPSLRVSVFWG